MCGRFTLTQTPSELLDSAGADQVRDITARYNIAPGQFITTILRDPEYIRPIVQMLIWGFVPAWAKDVKKYSHPVNARSEDMARKPMFRESVRYRRCIIPADGFYEWKKAGGRKIPHYIAFRDRRPFGMAGLWDRHEDKDGAVMDTCLILTTSPNSLIRQLHDRMPVILKAEDYARWLDPSLQDAGSVMEMIAPADPGKMVMHEVSDAVNSAGFDSPVCIKPFTSDAKPRQEELGL